MQAAKKLVPVDDSRPVIDVERPQAASGIDAALMKMVAATKSSPLKIMRDYAGLAFGPGRVSFGEYTKLRLFDDAFWSGADKREVVGTKRNVAINHVVNFRHDWWGLLSDKIASASYLSAYGFPTISFKAIYADHIGGAAGRLLRDEAALRAFLLNEGNYPLFGKPAEGLQSLGSIALRRPLADDMIEAVDGRAIPLDRLVAELVSHYATGYLFQPFTTPHPALAAFCGEKLPTFRLVTMAGDGEPMLFRACMKIPAGANMADNYWRSGNMLGRIDLSNGHLVKAVSGTGLDLVEHTHHPDTQAAIVGFEIPRWDAMKKTVIEAARLMRHVPLIGWDVSVMATGPVIVEMNETPDFFLNQLADARGVLDPAFNAFMARQKRAATERAAALKREQRSQ
jgi:hypothetical protein